MFCANCGNELDENDKFCGSCGTPVSSSETEPEIKSENHPKIKPEIKNDIQSDTRDAKDKKKGKKKGILAVVAILIIGVIGSVMYFKDRGVVSYGEVSYDEASLNARPLSDEDEVWGIDWWNNSEDPQYLKAAAQVDNAQAELDKLIAQRQQELEQQELEELAANYGVAGFVKGLIDSLGGEEGIYQMLASAIISGANNAINSIGGGSSDLASGSYDEGCTHKWVAAYYHQVGTSYTETEKIDDYTLSEDNYTTCAHLACYECEKCGSVKSYTLGTPGDYTNFGSYNCSLHFGEPSGSRIKVNCL